jgi:hypothetical protein
MFTLSKTSPLIVYLWSMGDETSVLFRLNIWYLVRFVEPFYFDSDFIILFYTLHVISLLLSIWFTLKIITKLYNSKLFKSLESIQWFLTYRNKCHDNNKGKLIMKHKIIKSPKISVKNSLNFICNSYKLRNPASSIHRFTHDYRLLDICQGLGILVTDPLYILTHIHHCIVFYGKAHKSVYFPNRTIEPSNNKTYTWTL